MPIDKPKRKKGEPARFDPGQPSGRGQNAQAAQDRGVAWSRGRNAYVDDEGCPQLDRFGQPLG